MLLVARGLLSKEQLEAALDEQLTTGRRLGEILVERGFIPHSTLSFALAEQYGIHPSAESGFGTGLRVLLGRDEATPIAAVEEPELPGVALEERLEEQWAQLAAAQERLATAERELLALQRRYDRKRAQALRLLGRIRTHEAGRDGDGDGDGDGGHLLFVQFERGYELLERDGHPPACHARLELADFPGTVFVVTTLGRSPLPHDARACAFAQPALG